MEEEKDPYCILGISPLSSKDDIKQKYRDLAKKFHPDLNPDVRLFGQEKMMQISKAYKSISDNNRRTFYDKKPILQLKPLPQKYLFALQTEAMKDSKKKKTDIIKQPTFMESIVNLFKKKDPKEEKKQKSADMIFFIATSYANSLSTMDMAINEMRDFTIMKPDCLEAIYNLGLMYYRKGDFDSAIIWFKKVLTKDSANKDAKAMIFALQNTDY